MVRTLPGQDPAKPERAELDVTLVPSLPSLNLDEVGDRLEAACYLDLTSFWAFLLPFFFGFEITQNQG